MTPEQSNREWRAAGSVDDRCGMPTARTEYFGLNHNSWDATYASKGFTDWLFAQRRQRR